MKPPAATTTIEPPQLDNIQLLIQRRAELQKNKAKYALTETDAQLLCTHSTEVQFEDGQIIVQEHQDIDSVYRVKSGKIEVSRNGCHFHTIGKGWFIGDPMFIYDTPQYVIKLTMKAIGTVVLEKINLPFIRQLFSIDHILHAKVMRYLVGKYSYFFELTINNLDAPFVQYKPEGSFSSSSSSSSSSSPSPSSPSPVAGSPSITPRTSIDLNPETAKILTAELSNTDELSLITSDSVSSISSISSISSSSSSSSSPSPSPSISSSISSSSSTSSNSLPPAVQASADSTHRSLSKREARAREHAAYKSYPLESRGGGIQTLLLKSKKITIVTKSFGFSLKTSVEFSKIHNITKVGENAVTIVYSPRKVANVFFKQYYDREEFINLVNSLITNSPAIKSPEMAGRRHSGQSLTVPHNSDTAYYEIPICEGEEGECCESLMTTQTFKKGEIIFEEGDLFQRVYTLTKGHCDIFQKGKKICTMEEGEIFGMGTLLHLRPVAVTLKAGSDVELMVVPAYKLNALIETDAARAATIYREAARALDRKLSQAMGFLPNYKRILREAKEKRAEEEELNASSSPSPASQQEVVA